MRNLAIWGLGSHAIRNLVPSLNSCSNINLIGAWTRNQETLSRVSSEFGIIGYGSERELLTDTSTDTVVVSTPTGLHIEHGLSVVRSGKSLWSEKSLLASQKEIEEFLSLASSSGLVVCEGFMFLYHEQFKALRDLIESGRLGRVFSISCIFGIPHLDPSNIRYSPELGGGALLDAGCYPIAAAHALLGHSPSRITSSISSEEGYDVDTYGNALLEYEGGASAFLEWGFGMNYTNEIRVRCESGTVLVNRAFSKPASFMSTIEVRDSHGEIEFIPTGPCNHFSKMFEQDLEKTGIDWVDRQSSLLESITRIAHLSAGNEE